MNFAEENKSLEENMSNIEAQKRALEQFER